MFKNVKDLTFLQNVFVTIITMCGNKKKLCGKLKKYEQVTKIQTCNPLRRTLCIMSRKVQ